jgi:hypothetical protein
MRENGWKPVKRLRGESDVARTPFGLVSTFEAYVEPAKSRQVAQLLVQVEGVELCTLPENGGWTVIGENSDARIQHRVLGDRDLWSYEPQTGDPLQYASIMSELEVSSQEPWTEDSRWLEASASAEFPDALYRIARSYDLVTNAASIVCSLQPGYMFGALRTDYAARLAKGKVAWTHGALRREDTLGFIMSDREDWSPPKAVRFDASLVPFAMEASPDRSVEGDERKGL